MIGLGSFAPLKLRVFSGFYLVGGGGRIPTRPSVLKTVLRSSTPSNEMHYLFNIRVSSDPLSIPS